ncbi:MAG: hypothetical protein LBF89_07115 [Bacteroidales bacterium]|jgi:hypothetical protein|nr:hypothetical protein [Bacteroidales bacterium]
MSKVIYSRRTFIRQNTLAGAGMAVMPLVSMKTASKKNEDTVLRISVFDMDATPPVGSYLTYDQMIGSYDLGLRAKGMVLLGAGSPVVLCAIDWIGIANESQDVFKQTLAEAAHTTPDRVAVHTLHQHDAPICDFSAEKVLREAGVEPKSFDSTFARQFLERLGKTVAESLTRQRDVTRIGLGKAPVYQVASNRRIVRNGKVGTMRATACKDASLRAEPEGLIDPDVTLISFWNDQSPVAVLTFYATHPQSYYLTKIANPDFPGIARFYRQLAVPDALHIHFNGAGGNIGAGKYNDGSHENRLILARRLADGMERAWQNSVVAPVFSSQVSWETLPVLLPVAENLEERVESQMKTADMHFLTNNMSKLIWMRRRQAGKAIDIACLKIGKAGVLFMPGELFVEYQLAAKALRPEMALSMAAYGDYGPFYIGTKEAYSQGGYEIGASPVSPDAEDVLMDTIRKLLR